MTEWTQPKYPGDTVRLHMLSRVDPRFGSELGDIRIQHYGATVRVATFLPGVEVCHPGDTPKVEPEFNNWYAATDIVTADEAFDEYVRCAREGGWKDYKPNG